jgi:hypothetical protein
VVDVVTAWPKAVMPNKIREEPKPNLLGLYALRYYFRANDRSKGLEIYDPIMLPQLTYRGR